MSKWGLADPPRAGPSLDGRGKFAAWERNARLRFGPHFLALADQAIVSGTAFLSTVLVGRWTNPGDLGIYIIALSVLGSLTAVQEALILLPYTIQRHRSSRAPAEDTGIALLCTAVLAGIAMAALATAAATTLALGAETKLMWLILALALALPFALLREFGRSYAFAHMQVSKALILDAGVAIVQLGALGSLRWADWMSGVGACAALGGACALTSAAWLYQQRSKFIIRTDQLRRATSESWMLGKWLCAAQIASSVHGYAGYWLLPLLFDMIQTGIYAACNTMASLANPLVTAFCNVLMPRAIFAFKEGGGAKLRRQAELDALLITGAMSIFSVAIFFGGDIAMSVVFHHLEYDGRGHVITVLAVAIMVGAAGAPASNALASMERPRAMVLASSAGAIVTIAAVYILSREWGLLGVAYGVLVGWLVGTATRWAAFRAVLASAEAAARDRA
jgi:O-antigen/teichoic acid export membrane protein